MRTHKQIEASRRNGALSKGPITPEGKARSAGNSTTHGLTAQTIVLTNECPPRFEALLNSFIEQFQPANESELCGVEETALLAYQLESTEPFDAKLHASIDQTTRGALAWNALHETSSGFHKLSRYEAIQRRSYRCALEDLLTLKKLKTQNEPNTPRNEDPQ